MNRRCIRIQYNSPVVLSMALVSFCVLLLNFFTNGASNEKLFSVYRSPLNDFFTYPRFILHVLGHSGYSHYIGNMMMILVVGPPLEERYGSRSLLRAILITALVSGIVHWIFFPGTALLGASGIVFMLMVMSSLAGMRNGNIPMTLIIVMILYVGREFVDGITISDEISQVTHIIGGVCGALLGINMRQWSR